MMEKDTITLPAQVGGPDASDATMEPWKQLYGLLSTHCKGPYSPDVAEFAVIFRIDGKLVQWNREGCAYLRRSLKKKYITIDIFVPVSRWKRRTEREIKEYFAERVREALTLCIKRLQKDKTEVDGEQLLKDYDKAVKKYLRAT